MPPRPCTWHSPRWSALCPQLGGIFYSTLTMTSNETVSALRKLFVDIEPDPRRETCAVLVGADVSLHGEPSTAQARCREVEEVGILRLTAAHKHLVLRVKGRLRIPKADSYANGSRPQFLTSLSCFVHATSQTTSSTLLSAASKQSKALATESKTTEVRKKPEPLGMQHSNTRHSYRKACVRHDSSCNLPSHFPDFEMEDELDGYRGGEENAKPGGGEENA